MRKMSSVIRRSCEVLQDQNLLHLLRSEIHYELSSNRYQISRSSSLGDFVVDYDSPQSQDVVLRRKFESGEEVAVSALLGSFSLPTSEREDSLYARDVSMKVCVKKPGLSSLLQFDCEIYEEGSGSQYQIQKVYYRQSPVHIGPSDYGGPFRCSDYDCNVALHYDLERALKVYLVDKGVGEELTNFLMHHLHRKEQGQYVNWLQKLESFVAKPE